MRFRKLRSGELYVARFLEEVNDDRDPMPAKPSDADVDAYNVVAEIPGGSKKEEIVMLGAHFDSWHSGTGPTDMPRGSAVMMEVVRILKTLNLKMDRTVRIALWSGEQKVCLAPKLTSKSILQMYA